MSSFNDFCNILGGQNIRNVSYNDVECNHSTKITTFCTKKCFSTDGSSAKFIEGICKPITNFSDSSVNIPYDLDDFNRCMKLLIKNPNYDLRKLLVYPKWKPLITNWTKLTEMYHDGMKESLDKKIRELTR